MTIKQVLQKATGQLKKGSIKNPALEAEILLSHILKKNREFLFAHPEKKLTIRQVKNYKKLIAKRLKGWPVAYLTGQKEFYGLEFFVNKNVLIPRPETELIVKEALTLVTRNAQRATLIDVGTGSGCIIISIVKELSSEASELSSLIGIDISRPALAIAKKNAKLHKINKQIKFFRGDLLESIIKNRKLQTCLPVGKVDNCKLIILANLPYLTPFQIKSSSTIKYDPKIALDGGKNGLKYYKKLFRQIKQLISLEPISCSLLCEIDPGQAKKIKKLAQSELPKSEIQIKKDLAGRNRLAIIQIYK